MQKQRQLLAVTREIVGFGQCGIRVDMQVQITAVILATEGQVEPVARTIGENVPDNGKPRKYRRAEGQDVDKR
ncbi:hypothetical protein D3C80_1638480 [compost metagenome]